LERRVHLPVTELQGQTFAQRAFDHWTNLVEEDSDEKETQASICDITTLMGILRASFEIVVIA
jgi:hypothetical protein